MKITIIHGPNLDRLGTREPAIYGAETLDSINQSLITLGGQLGAEIHTFQSPIEGEIVREIHRAADAGTDGLLVNAAAYTHTSIAIRDALAAVALPFIEVHLSNTARREPFRHHSYLTDLSLGLIMGFGGNSYRLALRALIDALN